MFIYKIYLLIVISIFLNACGGGATSNAAIDSATIQDKTLTPNTQYQGARDLGVLTTNNQLTTAIVLVNAIARLSNAINLLIQPLNRTTNHLTYACEQGGTLTVTNSLNPQIQQGTLSYTANECVQAGIVMNGAYHLTIQQYDATTGFISAATLSYDTLVQQIGNELLYPRGDMQLKDEIATRGQLTAISQVTYTYSNQLQSLDINLTLAMTNQGDNISGQLCINSSGCLSLSTPYAFSGNDFFNQGQLIIEGKHNSSLRLNTAGNSFWLDLDKDGDGLYETTTDLNYN